MLRDLDCELKPLDLSAVARVPHDASLVLIPGGEKAWSETEAEKLGMYLRQGGKALVLVELTFDSRLNRPAPIGLEDLLSEFGVAVGNDRVVTRGFTGQIEAASLALPAGGDHPLVRSLPQSPLTLFECRSLMSSAGVRQIASRVVPLLVSHAAPRAWAEGDFDSPQAPQPGGPNDCDGPVAMAVAVERRSEAGAVPALVVVGDAEFLSNRVLAGPAGRVNSSFVLSCINWLRGRRELLGDIPPRRHEGYRLSGSPDDLRGLVWKSSLALWALIATAGVTVWTTRRVWVMAGMDGWQSQSDESKISQDHSLGVSNCNVWRSARLTSDGPVMPAPVMAAAGPSLAPRPRQFRNSRCESTCEKLRPSAIALTPPPCFSDQASHGSNTSLANFVRIQSLPLSLPDCTALRS